MQENGASLAGVRGAGGGWRGGRGGCEQPGNRPPPIAPAAASLTPPPGLASRGRPPLRGPEQAGVALAEGRGRLAICAEGLGGAERDPRRLGMTIAPVPWESPPHTPARPPAHLCRRRAVGGRASMSGWTAPRAGHDIMGIISYTCDITRMVSPVFGYISQNQDAGAGRRPGPAMLGPLRRPRALGRRLAGGLECALGGRGGSLRCHGCPAGCACARHRGHRKVRTRETAYIYIYIS